MRSDGDNGATCARLLAETRHKLIFGRMANCRATVARDNASSKRLLSGSPPLHLFMMTTRTERLPSGACPEPSA